VRRHAGENRDRIVAAAAALFAERGVAEVSMNAIAQRAGVGPGTLYRHFRDKAALCEFLLVDSTLALERDVLDHLADGHEPAAAAGLEWFLQRMLDFARDNAALMAAMVSLGEAGSQYRRGPLYAWSHAVVVRLLHASDEAIRSAAGPRAAADAVDLEWLADALLSAVAVDVYLHQRTVRQWSHERVAAGVGPLVARLCGRHAHRGRHGRLTR
jgi:AcrR family transcriptional regulator